MSVRKVLMTATKPTPFVLIPSDHILVIARLDTN